MASEFDQCRRFELHDCSNCDNDRHEGCAFGAEFSGECSRWEPTFGNYPSTSNPCQPNTWNNEMVSVAVESGEEIQRREMSEKEKYPTLFTVDEETRASIFPFE
ncbi:MAG: hypothetical protein K2H64_04570 [Desulfovibrio sp.]|nr:hypothetical protein [Desulfovibrio sp.]